MRSSSGEHFLSLDHVRALAAFMVFSWHFCHGLNGYPVQFDGAPIIFPFALLDEGHTGVSLFMTLSGYLFAKLLDNKSIDYKLFIYNRILRLLPLFAFVLIINLLMLVYQGKELLPFIKSTVKGIVLPTLPNGGWSITAEFHFYLVLPFLLVIFKRHRFAILTLLAAALTFRLALYYRFGEVQTFSYWTIIGRIDQFMIGIVAFKYRNLFKGRHAFALIALASFCAFYWAFDIMGGFYNMPSYPSSSPLWIVMPTIEGLAYAILISYYDETFSPQAKGASWLLGKAGGYSYSIYLLHFFFVFGMAQFIDRNLLDLSNWYVAQFFATICFLLMIPIGYLSFRYIESPFLKSRLPYTRVRPGQ